MTVYCVEPSAKGMASNLEHCLLENKNKRKEWIWNHMGSHYQVMQTRKLLVIPGFSICLDTAAPTFPEPSAFFGRRGPSSNQPMPVAFHHDGVLQRVAQAGSSSLANQHVLFAGFCLCVCVFWAFPLQIAAPFFFSARSVSIHAALLSPSAVLGPSGNSFLVTLEVDCLEIEGTPNTSTSYIWLQVACVYLTHMDSNLLSKISECALALSICLCLAFCGIY